MSNKNSVFEVSQSQYCIDKENRDLLAYCENKYKFVDEIESFKNLVNFSTAKKIPYQRWVRYREGYSTSLVKELIKRSGVNSSEDYIADPMMGSGSTVLAAAELGYDTLGLDVNPYCEVVATLKLMQPTNDELMAVSSFVNRMTYIEFNNDFEENSLDSYFPDDNLAIIKMIKCEIDKLEESNVKKILFAAWLFSLEDLSNRKKDGNGLATRPAPKTNVVEYFSEIIECFIEDYQMYPLNGGKNYLRTASAFDLSSNCNSFQKECDKKLGAVIFSPPYANSFNYFESYKLELLFGGLLSYEDFNKSKKQLVRNYRISYGEELSSDIPWVEALCRDIWIEIPKKEERTGKRDGRTRLMPNMLRGYFFDMNNILKQIYLALKKGGKCYIVVDQSSYVGVIIPTDVILAYLGEQIGFKVDSISICRKASTSGQQMKQYPYLKNTLRESIVALEK